MVRIYSYILTWLPAAGGSGSLPSGTFLLQLRTYDDYFGLRRQVGYTSDVCAFFYLASGKWQTNSSSISVATVTTEIVGMLLFSLLCHFH